MPSPFHFAITPPSRITFSIFFWAFFRKQSSMHFCILLAVSPVPYFDCTLMSIFCVISLASSRATVFEKRIVLVSPFTHGGLPLSNCPHSLIAASISGDRYVSTPKAFSASVLNNILIFSLNHAIKPIIYHLSSSGNLSQIKTSIASHVRKK